MISNEEKSRRTSLDAAATAVGDEYSGGIINSKTHIQPTRKQGSKDHSLSDARNAVAQLQSQEKKIGDRQSVPNIEESITVQLGNDPPANDENVGKN